MKCYLKFFLLALMVICIAGTNIIYAQPQFPLTAHYPGNPILGKGSPGEWDSGIVYVSQAVYLDSLFYLFYSGAIQSGMPNSVGYAKSPDGFNPFTKYTSNPILAGDGSGFDALDVEPGALLLEGDSLIMYYGGGFGVAVGRAASVYPFDNWVRRDTPVLGQGSMGEWDSGFIHAQSVLKTDNGYMMYYTGGSAPLPAGVLTWRIGMATSTDGIHWTKFNDPATTSPPYAESDPVLKPGTSPNWDADFVFAPSVRKTANNYEMFYTGAENPNGFGYAVSTDGIHWTKDTNNPIYVVADDPYAVSSGGVLEGPSVVLKDSVYYVYYDYGLFVGEIGMATAKRSPTILSVPNDYPSIQAGINAAINGDTVLVADSTYYENINFKGKAIIVASHYIVDGDTNHINNTIIDGSQPSNPDSGSVVYFISGEDTNSVLCGFTIAGGTGTYVPPNPPSLPVPFRLGGGICCSQSGAYIKNNHIIENGCIIDLPNALAGGGGISVDPPGYNSFVIIEMNKIMNNLAWAQGTATNYYDAWAQGGGMALFTNGLVIKNEVLSNQCKSNNSVSVGGGIRLMGGTVDITDNNINGNSAVSIVSTGFAGGISCSGANTIIDLNRITNNFIAGASECYGAAVYFDLNNNANWAIVNKNLISGNYSTSGTSCGGAIGMYRGDPEIYNNIVAENSAHLGGAFGILENCQPRLINNTIVNNQASLLGGGLYNRNSQSLVLNSILWGNTASQDSQVHVFSGSVILKYSNVKGGWPGEGNIDADPQLVADSLANSSPCIGAGILSYDFGGVMVNAPAFDINGRMRPYPSGSDPDIGAWESKLGTPVGIHPKPVAGMPKSYELEQNYPNPFNPATTIEFTLPNTGFVTLKVYNILGEEVATLVSEKLTAGKYKYDWDAEGCASGVYIYKLIACNRFEQSRKLLLLR